MSFTMESAKLCLMRVALSALFGLFQALSAQAQDAPDIVVGWGEFPPFISSGTNGDPEGFSVDLIDLIGDIAGFEHRFQPFDAAPAIIGAQANGTTQMFAGVAAIPALAATNLFSAPVAETQVRLFVINHHANDPDFTDPTDRRIGVVPPGAGSQGADIHSQNQVIEFSNDASLLIALLNGGIDGAVVPQERLLSVAQSIGVDHRIVPVGDIVRRYDRVVAVHESRADLLPDINDAIAQLEADGRLTALRQRYSLDLPVPAPEVLTVGVFHFPPYNIVGDNGSFSGFAVEHIVDLAELAAIDIQFQEISRAELIAGPNSETYDIVSLISQNDIRRQNMEFTLPTESVEMAIFTTADSTRVYTDLSSLGSDPVGILDQHAAPPLAQRLDDMNLTTYSSMPDLLDAFLSGELTAMLFPSAPMRRQLATLGLDDDVQEISPAFATLESSPGLRPGLGAIRERLNSVIPGYLLSSEYADLRELYFGDPVFWTPGRIYAAFGMAAFAFLALMGILFWQRQQQRQDAFARQSRELEREQSHSREQQKLLTELERSNRALDEFAYTASHDLKEPLRGIAINADFLARENVSDKGRERLERMTALTTRMEQLISDILYFSRLGRGEKVMKDIDPAHIIDRIVEELEEWLEEREGRIEIETDLPWLHAERAKIKAVFQNLIVNGLKYNEATHKTVRIGFLDKVEVNGRQMREVYYVQDNGIGIDPKNHEKIWRIFNRLNREIDYGAGTGAGLSFVRRIIEEYDSDVELVSQLGQGATFYFTLPMIKTEPQVITLKELATTG